MPLVQGLLALGAKVVKIHIKVFGHQHYTEHVGEVLAWQQSVEKYGAQPMQVPCVLLRTNDRVLLVPLQTEYRWTEVRVVGDAP